MEGKASTAFRSITLATSAQGGEVRVNGPVDQWWNSRWITAAAILASIIPLLWPRIPPLIDLPSHMASYRVALDLARSTNLQQYFGFEWKLIGNMGVDLLIMPAGRLLGLEAGTKLIVIMIPVLTVLGFMLIAREVHGIIPPTAFAALPLAYNYPFMFGFVNYCLSAALAMVAFSLWLRMSAKGQTKARAVAFAMIAAIIWVSHAIGWVILGVLCGAAELQRRMASGDSVIRAAAGTIGACLPLLTPVALMPFAPHESLSASGSLEPVQIAKWTLSLLRDRWMLFDLLSATVVTALIVAALVGFGGLRVRHRLGWPALALLLLFVIAPQRISGSDFVSARLLPYAAALGVLAIDPSGLGRPRLNQLAVGAVAFMAIRLVANTASFALYDRLYAQQIGALQYVPAGSRVVALASVPCQTGFNGWYNARLLHFPGVAVVRNYAFVNSTWMINGLHLMSSHYSAAGRYQSDPSQAVYLSHCPDGFTVPLDQALKEIPYRAFDRLWLVGIPAAKIPNDPRLTLLWSVSDGAIYRINRTVG